jgi:hypothetical protein
LGGSSYETKKAASDKSSDTQSVQKKYEMCTTITTTLSFTLEELSKSNLEISLDAVGLEVKKGSNSWIQASILVNRLFESDYVLDYLIS